MWLLIPNVLITSYITVTVVLSAMNKGLIITFVLVFLFRRCLLLFPLLPQQPLIDD